MTEINEPLVAAMIDGIQDKKGKRIIVADLSTIPTAPSRYFVVCEGGSPAQVEAITESIGEQARKQISEKPISVTGLRNASWVVLDYGTVVAHVFLPEAREFYDLEHLWADAAITEFADEQ